jgi:chromosome segregation ATPase
MSTVLERLFSKRREERAAKSTNWEQFVAQCEAETIDVDEADRLLIQFGKSEQELAEAIELRKRLVKARAQVASETDLQSEIELLENEIRKANEQAEAEIKAIRRKCSEQTNAMRARSNKLQADLSRIGDARVFLMENSTLPEDVSEKLAAFYREQAALIQQREYVQEQKAAHSSTATLTKPRYLQFEKDLAGIESRLKQLSLQASELEWSALL